MTLKFILFVMLFCQEKINAHEVDLEKIEAPFGEDDKIVVFETLRIKKFNRTSFVIDGKFEVKQPLDDNVEVSVDAYNFNGGQYKKMGDKKMGKFCSSVYREPFKRQYNVANDAADVKIPYGTCPYPAGKNEFHNFIISDDGLLPAYIPGGEKWRIDVRFLIKNEVLGGYNVYVIIRSEESMLKSG